LDVIPATKTDALQTAQITATGARSGRPGEGPVVEPVVPTGRALATQRDALLFRSEAILRHGGPAPAPYLAQQIGQLWPSPPPTIPKSAIHAYLKNSVLSDGTEHRASLLV
jgi:hypothetical protein